MNSKRDKFRNEIRKKEKHHIIKQMRQNLLSFKENMIEETEDGIALTDFIHRSLVQNQMLMELRQKHLLTKLRSLLEITKMGRQITLMLVLLGNILMDDVTLDEKQQIGKLCMMAYENPVFCSYIGDQESHLLSELHSIVHNLSSLCDILSNVDEELSVGLQKLIIKKVLEIVEEVAKIVLGRMELKDEQQERLINICFLEIDKVMKKFFYFEEEYQGELSTRFQRNTVYLTQLLKIHYSILNQVNNKPLLAPLHETLLQTERTLSDNVTMSNFPLYFQSNEYITICLSEIVLSRNIEWTRVALDILTNILMEQREPQLISVELMISEIIMSLGGQTFLMQFVKIDDLILEKLRLLEIWLTCLTFFECFELFLKDHWKQLVDFCCQILRKDQKDEWNKMSLKILIVLSIKMEEKETGIFQPYFQSIGGRSLIDGLRVQLTHVSNGSRFIENSQLLDELSDHLSKYFEER